MKFKKTAVILMLFFFLKPSVADTAGPQHIMSFKIPIIEGLQEYMDLLEYPSYVAVALDNCGLGIGILDNLNLKDDKRFDWSGLSVSFIKKDLQRYIYDINLTTSFGKVLPKIRLELDVSDKNKWTAEVSTYLKIGGMIPSEFTSRFEPKLLSFFSMENQKKILHYLQKASSRNKEIRNYILMDGYNSNRAVSRNSTAFSDVRNNRLGKTTILLYIITMALIVIPFYALRKVRIKGAQ